MARTSCYPSDLTDDEWALVEPLLPPAGSGGRPEKHSRREIVDAVLYVVRTGCAWRQLPADFPPWQTVYWYFVRWEKQRVTLRMLDVLRRQVRRVQGRDDDPSAGIIDSQSVKAADTVGSDTRGYDAGKKVTGRKRFIVTDTLGLLITVTVCAANVQDRDGAEGTLLGLYLTSPTCRFVFADAGFAGRLVGWAAGTLRTTLSIVRKPADQKGFAVLPRRWAVERTLAWLTAHRRLARDYERHPATSEAMIRWAAIGLMTRRLARGGQPVIRQARRPLEYL
ncbi:IS5 family transposase [Actinomadura nitritigenes]|uniref:IS5 family transposase n=1 Tax=Actinomadura nitritigenes TaxID=134602 RepID=UPI0036CC0B52